MARLGWQMDEKTQARYETGKQEGYISAMDEFHRGYETEEIFHEEDPLRVMRRLEAEGWMKHLFPALSAAKANVAELEKLRERRRSCRCRGSILRRRRRTSRLLTAKMAPKEVAALKKSFPRQGFVAEIEALEDEAKEFAAQFSGKAAATPSQAWKLLHAAKPEAMLWVAHTSKNAGMQSKFKGFFTEWPQAKQKLPYTLMQEMRIVPELPGYDELLDKLFFELMDGKLGTVEEMKAFLEPYSPPAPPPPVHLRRPRAAKKDAKPAKSRKKAAVEGNGEDVEAIAASGSDEGSASAPSAAKNGAGNPAKTAAAAAPAKADAKKAVVPVKAAAKAPVKAVAKSVAVKPAAKKAPVKAVSKAPAKAVKAVAKKAPVKTVAKKAAVKAVAKKAPAKVATKKAVPAKKAAVVKKVAAKAVPAKKVVVKHAPAKKAVKAAPRNGAEAPFFFGKRHKRSTTVEQRA